jgi:hypothetical protein
VLERRLLSANLGAVTSADLSKIDGRSQGRVGAELISAANREPYTCVVPVVFCASNQGGPEPSVLARFITDASGLHMERFDRRSARWVRDSRVAGFLTGHDDWAKRIERSRAKSILRSWGVEPSVLDAPVAQGAKA